MSQTVRRKGEKTLKQNVPLRDTQSECQGLGALFVKTETKASLIGLGGLRTLLPICRVRSLVVICVLEPLVGFNGALARFCRRRRQSEQLSR